MCMKQIEVAIAFQCKRKSETQKKKTQQKKNT